MRQSHRNASFPSPYAQGRYDAFLHVCETEPHEWSCQAPASEFLEALKRLILSPNPCLMHRHGVLVLVP